MAALVGLGCSDDGALELTGALSGIRLPAPQASGLPGAILAEGEIPASEAFDGGDFLEAHDWGVAASDCGYDLCVSADAFTGAGLVDGTPSSTVLVQLATPVQRGEVTSGPLDLVVAVDVSGSMAGERLDRLREGLTAMLAALGPDDRVTLIAWSNGVELLADRQPSTHLKELSAAVAMLSAGGGTHTYAGLFEALLHTTISGPGWQRRVIFLADGRPSIGIDDPAKFRTLVSAYAETGVIVSTVGLGLDFDMASLRSIARWGGGAFHFVEDPSGLAQTLADEVRTWRAPLALSAELTIRVGAGCKLDRVVGAPHVVWTQQGAIAEFPALYLHQAPGTDAPRIGATHGSLLLELTSDDGEACPAEFEFVWLDPASRYQLSLDAAASAGQPAAERAFVVLQVFAALHSAADLYADSDASSAVDILEAVYAGVDAWPSLADRADIQADLELLSLFLVNLKVATRNALSHGPSQSESVD